MRRFGFPKTEEERVRTHQYLYGDTELPARGTGFRLSPVAVMRRSDIGEDKSGLASVYTPNKIIIVSATTAMITGMSGFILTQGLRQEPIGVDKVLYIGIGSACIAGLTSFLVTRFLD